MLYICERKASEGDAKEKSPSKFLLRLIGGKMMDPDDIYFLATMSETGQALVYKEQGRQGRGPKLLGIFEGGRLEEFIESTTLEEEHLKDAAIRKEVAQNIARFHSLDMPFAKSGHEVLETLAASHKANFKKENFVSNAAVQSCGFDCNAIADFDFVAEADWVMKAVKETAGRFAFCVRDMNRLNCLVRKVPKENGERIVLIDYELGAYVRRGHDLGCHFVMWPFDIQKPKLASGIEYPSEEIQLEVMIINI